MKHHKKTTLDKLCTLFFILIFSSSIYFLGINDAEMYQTGLYSAIFFWDSFENLFSFFNDFNGPGVKVPIGSGPMFHPLNFFFYDLKLYFFLFFTLHLIIQFEFTKKIFKILRIQYNHILLLILLVFSFTNINYGLVDDWIGAFFGWAFFPIVFYYFVKIFIKKKINDYFKFSLFFSLWLINGHLGHITAYIIFFLIYFIFSIKNFKELRNLFRLPFLISIVFIIFICSESIYFIARELLNFNGWRAVQGTYDIINYIEIFYPKEEFLSKFSLYRLPGNPILIYICIFFSSISLINFLKSIIQKNKNLVSLNTISFIFKKISSNYALKFNLLFLIFLVFSLLPFLLFIPAISVGGFLPRDIVLYVGIFVFFYNYKKIKKNLRPILILLMISYSIFPFIFNVTEKIRLNENNYILNKNMKSNFNNKFESLDIKKNDFQRIYLSPDFIKSVKKGFFIDDNIFAITDLNKFNLIPFNGFFKYTSFNQFGDEYNTMRGIIKSHYNLINDDFFLNLFNISYVLIMEDEIEKINTKDLELIDTINTKEKKLFLFKNSINNYSITIQNLEKLKKNMESCKVRTLRKTDGVWLNKDSKLDCLLREKNLFIKSDYNFIRLSNSKYNLSNFKQEEYPVLPIIYDSNWISDKDTILINLVDFLIFLNTDKIDNYSIRIEYKDQMRILLKSLSLVSILFLFLIIYLKRINLIFIRFLN